MDGRAAPVTAYDRTDTTLIATGTLATTDNQIDSTTGTVKLRAIFPNTDKRCSRSNSSTRICWCRRCRAWCVAPQAAVQQGAPGSFVYLVKPDNTVAVQVVKTGVDG